MTCYRSKGIKMGRQLTCSGSRARCVNGLYVGEMMVPVDAVSDGPVSCEIEQRYVHCQAGVGGYMDAHTYARDLCLRDIVFSVS